MYSVVELRESWEVAKDVRAFRLLRGFDFTPGQFVMVWLPSVGEKPFSLAWKDLLLVKRVGPFTSKLFELEEGDRLWVRGPYGRGFEKRGERVALLAGGIGIPPLYALAKAWRKDFREITLIYGAKSREELALVDVENYVNEVVITTDDGSAGRRGLPTDVLAERKGEFDQVYACGPEPMLRAVLRVIGYKNVQISAERYMKCGIGVCGSVPVGGRSIC